MKILRNIILFIITLIVSVAITVFFVTNYIRIGTTQLTMESSIYTALALLSIYNLPLAENPEESTIIINNYGREVNYLDPRILTNKTVGYIMKLSVEFPTGEEHNPKVVIKNFKIELEPVFIYLIINPTTKDVEIVTLPEVEEYNNILNQTPTFCFPMKIEGVCPEVQVVCSSAKISIQEPKDEE